MDKKFIASILIVVDLLAITAGALLFFKGDTKQNSNESTANQTKGEPIVQNQEPEQTQNQAESPKSQAKPSSYSSRRKTTPKMSQTKSRPISTPIFSKSNR